MGRKDEAYLSELRDELDYGECLRVIDDYADTIRRWGIPGQIHFTGGDPLLKHRFFELLAYARGKGIKLGILGNSNLLDESTARKLADLGLETYQMSLDGMESTHDLLRRRSGLFQDTLRAIRLLEREGIRSVIMFTLHRGNAAELSDVIRLVVREGVSMFDFARLVPYGNGRELIDQMLEPAEYRSLLLNIFELYRSLQEQGVRTRFGRKDHLWTLLYQDLGLFKPGLPVPGRIYAGCGMACKHLTVVSDGRVLACRRLPIEIGRVPEQSLGDIFIGSRELNEIRDVTRLQKCSKCELLTFCRGCPAVAYGAYGDYTRPDPQCWKVLPD